MFLVLQQALHVAGHSSLYLSHLCLRLACTQPQSLVLPLLSLKLSRSEHDPIGLGVGGAGDPIVGLGVLGGAGGDPIVGLGVGASVSTTAHVSASSFKESCPFSVAFTHALEYASKKAVLPSGRAKLLTALKASGRTWLESEHWLFCSRRQFWSVLVQHGDPSSIS